MSDASTDIERRLAALERRLRAAEDQLEIIRLLSAYGPGVDTGRSRTAAELWVEDGAYDIAGLGRAHGIDEIAALYDSDNHQALIRDGCAHINPTPYIHVDGDDAMAVGYSFILLHRVDGGWDVPRASANVWTLGRTADGWRILERRNHVLNGDEAAHELLRACPA